MEHGRKRGRARRALLIALLVALLLGGAYVGVSTVLFHRSNLASVAELMFRLSRSKSVYASEARFERYLKRKTLENEASRSLREGILGRRYELEELNGLYVLRIPGEAEDSRPAVLFLHGGSYISDIAVYQLRYCEQLVKKTGADLYAPLYTPAPEGTAALAMEQITALYESLSARGPVCVIGDSAGGGLAAALCLALPEANLPQPESLILLSPWLDITMSNPDVPEYEARDPLLSAKGLREAGKLWAGETPADSPLVSPIYGDCSVLRNVLLFVGTREIFYPDATAFYEKLLAAGVRASLSVGEGLNHVYTEYPIPEAKDAFELVCGAVLQTSEGSAEAQK